MKAARPLVGLALVALIASACSSDGGSAGGPLKAQAGVNDPQDLNIAVLAFLPADFTVATGGEVEWSFPGPEPHSVTFFPEGEEPPAPDAASEYFAGESDTGTVDGQTLVNSGLRPFGPEPAANFTATFSEAGEFGYVCVIHPQMTGTITVSDDGGDAQADLDAAAEEAQDEYLAEGRAAKQQLVEAEVRSEESGGSTTWYVEMGTTTEHTDVLAFAPVEADVKAGDTVVFINNSGAPHTATFAGDAELPTDPESEEAVMPAPGGSPQTLNATDFFNTGWLPPNAPPGAGPPEGARSFAFEVPEAGEYGYVCLLHIPSGMVGSIKAT